MYAAGNLYRVPLRGAPAGERILPAGQTALFPAISRTLDRLVFARGSTTATSGSWRRAARPRRSSLLARRPEPAVLARRDEDRVPVRPLVEGGEIFVTRADGSNPIQLTDGLGDSRAAPSGRPTAAGSPSTRSGQDGTFDVFVIDAAGGPPRRLTADPSNEHRPSWSRDGRWIYFASDRTGRFEVWRVPAAGRSTPCR